MDGAGRARGGSAHLAPGGRISTQSNRVRTRSDYDLSCIMRTPCGRPGFAHDGPFEPSRLRPDMEKLLYTTSIAGLLMPLQGRCRRIRMAGAPDPDGCMCGARPAPKNRSREVGGCALPHGAAAGYGPCPQSGRSAGTSGGNRDLGSAGCGIGPGRGGTGSQSLFRRGGVLPGRGGAASELEDAPVRRGRISGHGRHPARRRIPDIRHAAGGAHGRRTPLAPDPDIRGTKPPAGDRRARPGCPDTRVMVRT